MAIEKDDGAEAFFALLDMSERLGMPKFYKTDLTQYDKAVLQDLHPKKFIWLVREMGTELLTLGPVGYRTLADDFKGQYSDKQRRGDINWMRLTARNHPEAKGFLFANGRLKPIDIHKTFPGELLDEQRSN